MRTPHRAGRYPPLLPPEKRGAFGIVADLEEPHHLQSKALHFGCPRVLGPEVPCPEDAEEFQVPLPDLAVTRGLHILDV